jgi:hypothetical protein
MSWRFVGGLDNLSLVLNPLFIDVCGIFSGRLGVLSKVPGFLLHVIFKTLVTVAALQKYLIVSGLRVTTKRQR